MALLPSSAKKVLIDAIVRGKSQESGYVVITSERLTETFVANYLQWCVCMCACCVCGGAWRTRPFTPGLLSFPLHYIMLPCRKVTGHKRFCTLRASDCLMVTPGCSWVASLRFGFLFVCVSVAPAGSTIQISALMLSFFIFFFLFSSSSVLTTSYPILSSCPVPSCQPDLEE